MRYGEKINSEFYGAGDIASDEIFGSFEKEDHTIGTGLVGAPSCGDVMKLQIKVENGKIIDAKILVFGCGSAKASSTYGTKELIGKTLDEALLIRDKDIAESLDLPKIKFHCSVLVEAAIRSAVEDYRKKNEATQSSNQINPFSITISEAAKNYIQKVLDKLNKNVIGIRLDLEESGCGLSYKIKYIDSPDGIMSNDIIHKEKDLCIFINEKISKIINGTTMDFKEEGLKAGIVFTNPNETGKCGCGMNFKTADTKIDESKCK